MEVYAVKAWRETRLAVYRESIEVCRKTPGWALNKDNLVKGSKRRAMAMAGPPPPVSDDRISHDKD